MTHSWPVLICWAQGGDKQEELEKLQKEGKKHTNLTFCCCCSLSSFSFSKKYVLFLFVDAEKARLLAEGNAAMEAQRAEAEAEAKRKRDFEREKARQALQEVSVNLICKEQWFIFLLCC